MDDELVTLETFRFLPEAEAVKLHLLEEGITVFLADAEDWLRGNAIGQVTMQVPQSQLERATAVVKTLRAKQQEREATEDPLEEDEDGPVNCLACGKLMPEEQMTCPACGWSYAETEEQTG